MAKVKLDLRGKTDPQFLGFAQTHVANMAGNANYATPLPSIADFDPLLAAFDAALLASDQAAIAAKAATQTKDDARAVLELALTNRGSYVDNASGGDEAMILSAGFPVRAQPAPVGDLPAPLDFLATSGDMPGEVDLTWSAVRGARTYVVDCKEDAAGAAWSQAKIVTRSQATAPGLTTGKTYVFRVKALGAAGEGPWSDISTRLAP